MRNPSKLSTLLAVGLAVAAGNARADIPPLDGVTTNSLEQLPPSSQSATGPGLNHCRELAQNREFIENDRQKCVSLQNFTTGKNSACIPLAATKEQDPEGVVPAYNVCLQAQQVQGLTANGLAPIPAGAGFGGGFHAFSSEGTGAPGATPPAPGANPSATPPTGAGRSPAVVALNVTPPAAGPGATGAPNGDSGPEATGRLLGGFIGSSGLTGTGPSRSAAAGAGAAPTPEPGTADGGALTDTSAIALTHNATRRANARMANAEKRMLGGGTLVAPQSVGTATPNPEAGGLEPAGGITTNGH